MTLAAAPNGTSHRYRVRFDEAGPDGMARASTLFRYAQDVAWLHSDELGFDRAWYRRRGVAWLVRCAEMEVLAPIPMGQLLDVSTAVVGHRRVWARRRGEVRLPDGSVAAWVHTDWVLVDEGGVVRRIPEEFGVAFPADGGRIRLGRVELPPTPPEARRAAIRVRPQELDPNAHVNNATYVDWLEEEIVAADTDGHVAESGERLHGQVRRLPRRYRLEYLAPAPGGAVLDAATWRDGGGWSQRLIGGNGPEILRARFEA